MEPYGGLLGSRQNCTGFLANGIPRCSALGHWGLTWGDEGYRLTGGDGEPEYITHLSGVTKEGKSGSKEDSQSS